MLITLKTSFFVLSITGSTNRITYSNVRHRLVVIYTVKMSTNIKILPPLTYD